MKKGVILFHQNIDNIYKKRWVEKSINSMIDQTDNDFTFYEINYGGEDQSVVPEKWEKDKKFWSIKLDNYAEAMNFILDKAFNDGCDYVFNTNLDDYYSRERIALQLDMAIKNELDITSGDFCYITEFNQEGLEEDAIIHFMHIKNKNIMDHLNNNYNVIAHPLVCYSKKFWSDPENRYNPKKVPAEDLDLWFRSINRGYKFGIFEDILLFYRRHNYQVSNTK